jgi:single-strand DNA-binding protein
MSDLNKVFLIGRLGNDPDMKYTASGTAIANLSVATGKQWTDKQSGERKESTEWHRVVFFGRTAEVCSEYLKKGSQVHIEGELRTRQWEDQNGQTRYTTEVVGREMIMLGGKHSGKAQQQETAGGGFRDSEPAAGDDDIPF